MGTDHTVLTCHYVKCLHCDLVAWTSTVVWCAMLACPRLDCCRNWKSSACKYKTGVAYTWGNWPKKGCARPTRPEIGLGMVLAGKEGGPCSGHVWSIWNKPRHIWERRILTGLWHDHEVFSWLIINVVQPTTLWTVPPLTDGPGKYKKGNWMWA